MRLCIRDTITRPFLVGAFLLISAGLAGNARAVPAIDIVYVVDESGSISNTEFAIERNFFLNVTNSLSLSPTGTRASLGAYATSGRTVLNLSGNNATVVNAIQNVLQLGGSSCISCGLQVAIDQFNSFGNTGATRIVLFMTDGNSTVAPDPIAATVGALDALGVHLFPIISDPGSPDLDVVNSLVLGGGEVFQPADFNQFAEVFAALIASGNNDIPEPTTLAIFAFGLAGLGCLRRRKG